MTRFERWFLEQFGALPLKYEDKRRIILEKQSLQRELNEVKNMVTRDDWINVQFTAALSARNKYEKRS